MFTDRELRAIAKYDEYARANLVNDFPIWADYFMLDTFSNMFGDRFVDVGCGDGRFSTILHELGINSEGYLGIDPSTEQIKLAQKLHPDLSFDVSNIYELGTKYADTFDGFTCAAMMMLIPRSRILEALCSLRNSLKPDAVGFISTPIGKGEGITQSGVTITFYEPEEFHMYLNTAGFDATIIYPSYMMIMSVKVA